MSQSRPRYRITPSLLNKFQEYVDAELLWEKFYGSSDDPAISLAEYEEKCEKELLDACNRVPFVSEAASKGTALNELVDCIVENRKQREDMVVERVYDPNAFDTFHKNLLVALRVELDGFPFFFDINLVRSLADYFKGCTCQYRCEAIIDTCFGPAIVYGDADYIRMDVVYDLKSTGKYDFGKFEKGWQKHVYPYALIWSGEMQSVSGFEYTAVQLRGGNSKSPIITGDIYKEWYDFNFDDSKKRLRDICEAFIAWVEAHRELITHKRIFNEE